MDTPEARVEPSSPSRSHFSRATKTFVVRLQGPFWFVADQDRNAGGIFASLRAALKFARWESAHEPSASVVILTR